MVDRWWLKSSEEELVPLTSRGGGHGSVDVPTPRRRNSCSSSSSSGYGMAGVRVAGAVMFALVLTGLAGLFDSVEENIGVPRAAASMTELDLDETKTVEAAAVVGGNGGISGPTKQGVTMVAKEVEATFKTSDAAPAAGVGSGVSTSSEVATSKPNVFFIMIDDMGWADIGYQSTDLAGVTPNMDKLAAGGVKLTQYYSMSICTPARASLMTGRYPIRYGLQYNVIQPGAPWGLPLSEKIFPEYMKEAGYETHMVGKWHLGSFRDPYVPHRRGFDTYLGYLNDKEMYWTHQPYSAKLHGRKFFDFGFGNATDYYDVIERSSDPTPPRLDYDDDDFGSKDDDDDQDDDGDDDKSDDKSDDYFSTGPTSSSSSSSISFKGKYSTTIFQERAMEVIKDKTPYDEEPLFLYLAHQAVHDPLGLPPADAFTEDEWAILDGVKEHSDSALRLRFAKVVMYLDKTIGELVDYLEEEGWMENSIIALASDNGGCATAGGSNYPLRGMKHSYWEGGVKVPALVYSTSHIPEEAWGTEYAGLMHVTDWLPTLASGIDLELTGNVGEFDGIDHWPYIISPDLVASSESPRTEMLYNYDPYVMWADGDEIENADFTLAQGAYRLGKWKFIFNAWCQGYYTFDQQVLTTDNLTDSSNTCDGLGSCYDCGVSCVDSATASDSLFDLEADPREETNLVDLYPEVVGEIRARLGEVVAKEYSNSTYEDINHDSYYVWAAHDWWIVPWFDELADMV